LTPSGCRTGRASGRVTADNLLMERAILNPRNADFRPTWRGPDLIGF
jgi:hypothetical protein